MKLTQGLGTAVALSERSMLYLIPSRAYMLDVGLYYYILTEL
jgi:hypothetical protein